MMYLITGMPGNGKTLYAVDFIRKERAKGREVFSDIKGLTVEGVQPAPDDWRTVPNGALVVYDEAHKRFPSFKGKGRSPLEVVRDMDEHRHRGVDLMFLTQWPDKIDSELFRLVGTHWHLNRAFGLQKANLVMFSRAVMNPYSATSRKGADESLWDFPQDAYALYKSSSLHTDSHKFKLPAKVRNALISVPFIIAVLWGFTVFIKGQFGASEDAERSAAEPTPSEASAITSLAGTPSPAATETQAVSLLPGVGEHASLNTATTPTLAGCVSSERGCRCFNSEGFQIDMARHECEATLQKPLPFNVFHQFSTGSAPAGERRQESPRANSVTVSGGENSAQTFPESPGYQCETCGG